MKRIARDARTQLAPSCSHLSQPALVSLVEAALTKIARYGITDADDVVPLARLIIAHGLDFETRDDFAWCIPLLKSTTLSSAVKVALLFERLPPRLRPEAQRVPPKSP